MQGGYQYHSVIFERQAYALSDRFVRGKSLFSVGEAVKKELKHTGYLRHYAMNFKPHTSNGLVAIAAI